jgi:hypothetical protein
VEIYGTDTLEYGPDSHYAFCAYGDGDCFAIDLAPTKRLVDVQDKSRWCIIDCFHETYPDVDFSEHIAPTFSEFLRRALESEGNTLFWIHDDTE